MPETNHAALHVILTPVGSAGDVHPFIGIGRALRQRGHEVTVVVSEYFRKPAERAGLDVAAMGTVEDFEEATNDPDLWHPRRGVGVVMKLVKKHMRQQYERIGEVFEPGRSILVGHTLAFGTRVFEDKHECAGATAHIAPSCFRSLFEMPAADPRFDLSRLPRFAKRAFWWLLDRVFVDRHIEPALNDWRRELGLSPVHRILKEWVHSPNAVIALFPEWFRPPSVDWPKPLFMTDFPLFDEAGHHALDDELETFLRDGDAPIAFTPGSAMQHGKAFFEAAIDAGARLGRRALLLSRYRENLPATLPSHALHVTYAPFSELLPRCAALVHHGGIGTTAQGLRAGIPHVVMPMGFDQPDNVTRLHRLGVGTWVRRRRFTGKRVAAALDRMMNDDEVRAACATWAEKFKHANPAESAAVAIEKAAARANNEQN